MVSSLQPELHVLADSMPANRLIKKINIEAIPYADSSFDFIIANYVLERVVDLQRALSEINRALKLGGFAILQTSYSNKLAESFEDSSISSDDDKIFFYGQGGHVRLFGRDVFSKFETFLEGSVFFHDDIFDSSTASTFGVNKREPLFLYRKRALKAVKETISSGKTTSSTTTPTVSISCVTYNHENFIARALDSFLSQKTNFEFEIVIGDDASTDSTLQVVRKYARAHPNKIRVLESKVNQGMHKNGASVLKSCRGKFVAICDGDDYWCDVNKLQLQHDVLSQGDGTVLVYSGVQAHRDGHIDYEYIGGIEKDCSQIELLSMPVINTATAMFINVFRDLPSAWYASGAPDLFIWGYLGLFGSAKFIPTILPSIYNIYSGGSHSSKSVSEKLIMHYISAYALSLLHGGLGNSAAQLHFKQTFISGVLGLISGLGPTFKNKIYSEIDSKEKSTAGLIDFQGETLKAEIDALLKGTPTSP